MTYIIIICFIIFFWNKTNKNSNKQIKKFNLFVWFLFVSIIGLRCVQTGQDTLMYREIYNGLNEYNSYKYFMIDFNFVNSIEVGYATWQWIVHLLFDYRGFLICQAILMITPFVYVVYKWSDNVVWSFVLYILLGYLTWNMCAARQAHAPHAHRHCRKCQLPARRCGRNRRHGG